jgi:arylsulfatase
VYDKNPEDLRLKRLDALIKAGFVAEGVEPYPMVAETPEWHELNEDQKKVEARRMEIYAAMVEEMNMEIGRLVHKLESIDELDNTFVSCMSDNGAEGSLMEAKPASGSSMGRMSKLIKGYFNNMLENMGKKDSFVVYGPRWALAATALSRGFKSMTSEDVIRCPCIIRYPGLGRASTGGIGHEFINVMDICPTLLEMSGLQHPHPTFRGHDVVSTRGKSWMPYLSGSDDIVYDSKLDITGWQKCCNVRSPTDATYPCSWEENHLQMIRTGPQTSKRYLNTVRYRHGADSTSLNHAVEPDANQPLSPT